MKQVKEVIIDPPDQQKSIQLEVQKALGQFMQSFTSALVTSLPNTTTN